MCSIRALAAATWGEPSMLLHAEIWCNPAAAASLAIPFVSRSGLGQSDNLSLARYPCDLPSRRLWRRCVRALLCEKLGDRAGGKTVIVEEQGRRIRKISQRSSVAKARPDGY